MLTGPPPKFHGTWDILREEYGMRYRRYIERMGAWAVALGMGVALASCPPPALADPTEQGPSDTHSSSTTGTTATENTSTSTTTEPTSPRSPSAGSTVIGRSTLVLPGSNGYAVNTTWYFPNHDEAPIGLIFMQHGWTRTDTNLSALAQQLADQTNSIVVSPTVSSNPSDRYYILNDPINRAVAALFVGDRSELTASAAAAAGHPVSLPQHFVLAAHSAAGTLATAGYLVDAGAASNLKAVILFDSVADGDATTGMAKLAGANAVPVMLIAADVPVTCNDGGAATNTTINSAPDKFVAIMLDHGSHLDAEGANTDSLATWVCGPAPTPQNAAAVQIISAAWINDAFTGSHTGIYAPAGTVIAVDGATARVLAVKGLN